MPAVVRVKRRIDEEPLSAFILNGKKRRLSDTDSAATETLKKNENDLMSMTSSCGIVAGAVGGIDAKDEISTILKFAGTVEKPDDLALTQYARLTKNEAKDLIQRKSHKPQNPTERARQEMRQSAHENRFRVVNCLRTTLDTSNTTNDNAQEQHVTIVDIEKQTGDAATTKATLSSTNNLTRTTTSTTINTNNSLNNSGSGGNNLHADSDTGYVYDLYIPENDEQAHEVDLLDDYYLSVKYFDENDIWDLRYNTNNEYNVSFDSEDSNDENCPRNDYPDEDEFSDCKSESDANESESENDDIGHVRHKLNQFDMVDEFSDDDDDEDDDKIFKYGNSTSDETDNDEYQDPYVGHVDADDENFVDDIDFFSGARKRLQKYRDAQGDDDGDDDDDDDDDNDNVDKMK